MTESTATINAQGRITLPAAARRSLGLEEGSKLEVRVEGNEIRLRPARLVIAEDAWAYTTDSLRSIKRALSDVAAGRVYEMTPAELERGVVPARRKRKR